MADNDPNLLMSEIVTYLGSNGIGTYGTNLFIGTMPPNPIVATVVVHQGGPWIPGSPMRFPAFLVQHRNTHISSGLPKAQQIHNLLSNAWNVLSTIKGRIVAGGEPGAVFLDANGTYIFPMNFNMVTTDRS